MRSGFVFSIDSFFSVLITFTLFSLVAVIQFNPVPYSIYSLDSATRDFLVLKYYMNISLNETFDFEHIHIQEARVDSPIVAHSTIFLEPEICNGITSLKPNFHSCLNQYDLPTDLSTIKKEAWGYYR